jgi:hypothetical protein
MADGPVVAALVKSLKEGDLVTARELLWVLEGIAKMDAFYAERDARKAR